MKLSEAILLGIGSVREERYQFLNTRESPCGCAIGTALYSMGVFNNRRDVLLGYEAVDLLEKYWPWTKRNITRIDKVSRTISDRHVCGESRESIAAWVASIEPKDEPIIESSQLTTNKEVCYEAK